jgi:hypothetical protein
MQLGIVIIISSNCKWYQELLNGILDQQRVARFPHDLNDRPAQLEIMFNNGNETVRDDYKINIQFQVSNLRN